MAAGNRLRKPRRFQVKDPNHKGGVSSLPLLTEMSKCMTARQKLEAQLTENHVVKEVRSWLVLPFPPLGSLSATALLLLLLFPLQELDLLDSSNSVYKLIGPVLVKQDTEEAKATVGKRLEYITGEM